MRTSLRRHLSGSLVAALGLGALVVAAPASAAELPSIVINEVETDGGSPGDWIELKNRSDAAVDVSGWWVEDGGNPAEQLGTLEPIAADGYLVLDKDVHFSFGLGKAETITIYAADGETVIDTHTFPDDHAATTYGRCADGEGDFALTASSTRGAENDCASETPVEDPTAAEAFVLNEIVSSGGDPDDWIELYNTADVAVDAAGLQLRDGDVAHANYVIPADTVVAAGGFVVVEKAQFDWGLGGEDSVTLFDVDGATVVDEYSWSTHASTSYGRCVDGSGAFAETATVTKGAANDCAAAETPAVVVNEVESSDAGGGLDWAEFYNAGAETVDLSGYRFQDNDPTHDFFVFPDGFTLEPGEFFVVHGDTESEFPHGLGSNDSAILYAPDGVTVVDSCSWTSHAATTYGRCPDGTGEFATTTAPTKGAANNCAPAIVINEIESSDASGGADWVELANAGSGTIDLTGWSLKDNGDDDAFTFGAVTIDAGEHLLLERDDAGVTGFSYGLGGSDAVRLYDASATLVDSYAWDSHAAVTYGRCPDITGEFDATSVATPGAANVCPGEVPVAAWPGGASVTTVDEADAFGQDMSGLVFEAPGTLWAVNNGSGKLYKLSWNGSAWVPVTSDGWSSGKVLRYPGGTGQVDAEGVTILDGSSASGVYVASERNNDASSTSRPSILRFDVTGSSAELVAVDEWNLASDLASDIATLGANAGLEGIAWIPDSYLTANGLVDDATGEAYDPSDYPAHGSGLFFVAVEQDGGVYGYALTAGGGFERVTRFDSGFPGAMELAFDPERGALWVVCDELCGGESRLFTIAADGDDAGHFTLTTAYARPADAPNVANEGFAITPQSACVGGVKPVYWADDNGTDGHGLRAGTITCAVLGGGGGSGGGTGTDPDAPLESELGPGNAGTVSAPSNAAPGDTLTIFVGVEYAGDEVDAWVFSTPTYLGRHTVSVSGTISVTLPSGLDAGSHRIVILDMAGAIIGWDELEVAAAETSALASTGGESHGAEWLALSMLVAGAVLVIARRRIRTA
ncbi:lamin tail domain-containing protein [uncultured Schumannella sp.]|uniref:lamin tail domain-containing protein n=1 Tax=uncultured Schumannella sp. TaxID=1195956 RepID=UPI0025E828CF|nr:lamin tail domain-containing protein [uncultured Schumannella sp.]